MRSRHCLSVALLAGFISLSAQAQAEDEAPDYAERLLGDWHGARKALYDRGLDWEIVYKFDLLSKVKDSSQTGKVYWLDNLDIKLSVDGDKLWGWPGTRAFLHVLGNHGKKPAIESGRLPHGVDNIEVPEGADGFKVFHAWIERDFGSSGLSAKFGLYGLDSEFYVTESSGLFVHPTFGIGAEFAGSGQNGPSVFPNSSLALRLKYQPDPDWYGQLAVLDGVPGNPDHPQSTRIDFEQGDGLLYVAEAGYLPAAGEAGKLAVGLWRYSERFDDLLDVDGAGDPIQRRSQGLYLIGEATLWADPGDPQRRLRGFLRGGRNDGDTQQFDYAWSTGLVVDNWLPGRDSQFGISFSEEHNSEKWRTANSNGVRHERALELNYRAQATPWLAVNPFVQYLINHSSMPEHDRSWWLGLRLELNL